MGRRKYGQSVRAFINDEECSWQDDTGKYISSKVDASKGVLWYLWSGKVEPEDVIRVDVKTAVVGAGPDERRTFEALYYVDADAPVREVEVSGVGHRRYPLVKGRVLAMGSVSESDKRESEISEFMDDDGF
jgi:hypothetical protein